MKQEHRSGQSKRENRDSLVSMRRIDMSPYMPITFNIGSSGGSVDAISNSDVSLSRNEVTSLWCCLLRVSSILTNETLKIGSKTSSLAVQNCLKGTETLTFLQMFTSCKIKIRKCEDLEHSQPLEMALRGYCLAPARSQSQFGEAGGKASCFKCRMAWLVWSNGQKLRWCIVETKTPTYV